MALSELYTCCVTVISMGRDRHIAQKSVSQATPKQTKKYMRCIWVAFTWVCRTQEQKRIV